MGKEGRESRRERRRARNVDIERLEALEQRIEELAAARDALATELAQARSDVDRRLEAQAAVIAQQHLETVTQAKEDYRKQVGVLDLVRRQQKRQDETFGARVEAAEQAVAAAAAEQAERLGKMETRTDQLEVTARLAIGRIDGFDVFQTELGALIERMNNTIRSIRDAVEQLAGRVEAAEALGRQQLAHHAELREQVLADRNALQLAQEAAQRAASTVEALVQREQAISMALAALGPVPDRVAALGESVESMHDRLLAAELLLNQRNDLDLQLERAEEFERVLAEVDPTAYALRSDLDALRQELRPAPETHHAE